MSLLKPGKYEFILSFFIFIQWLIYENIILSEPEAFGGTIFLIFVFGYKFFFPFLLLMYTGFPDLKRSGRIAVYSFSVVAFLLWSLIPTMISGVFLSWIKLFPPIIFFLAVISFFTKNFRSHIYIMKFIIVYVMVALIQYIIILTTNMYEESGDIPLTGPFGLLGNTQGKFSLPGIDNPIIRLCGFWREPSNASGTAFASYFFGQYLYKQGESKIWYYLSILCFVAGILTLSNAGYLAIGLAFLVGFIFSNMRLETKLKRSIIFLPIIILFGWYALFSRSYFSENGSDNPYALAFAGVRSASNLNSVDYDPSDGRIDLIQYSINETKENFIGKGVQITGPKGIIAPPGGIFYWLLLTGFPGILFLIIRDFTLISTHFYSRQYSTNAILILQALVVIVVQQSVYGSLMDPNYFLVSAMVLMLPYWIQKQYVK